MATASDDFASGLLSLPTELRLDIWELLLAPTSSHSADSMTIVSRTCSAQLGTIYPTAVAHDWDDKDNCVCHARNFYLLENNNKTLSPAILQINRQVYSEALPCLYRDRTFTTDPNRTYESLHDKICDSWFLLDRFLAGIGEDARSHVRGVKVPMLLSKFEVYGSHEAFYSIVSRLPALANVHLEVCPSSVLETNDANDLVTQHHPERLQYWLGPVMAFADASIKIIAIDRNDLEHFDVWKNPIEVAVWQQLLPLRFKRERRKIARIRRALGSLEYSECAGVEDIFCT